MRREATNAMRAVLEDWLPAAARDTRLFARLARITIGSRFDDMTTLRHNAALWSETDFRQFYGRMKPGQKRRVTDNSREGIARIAEDLMGTSVLDVGCGTGYLLRVLRERRPDVAAATGVDVVVPDEVKALPDIRWLEAPITRLPLADRSFDTVVCTHTLEHVSDLGAAVAELRRVAAQRLIVVVPRERPYKYTFNAHLHFFPYEHSLLLALRPQGAFVCKRIGRDLYYREDV